MPRARIPAKRNARCGHYEQVKKGGHWKCVACGQSLTIPESIQNSIELSEVMRSAMVTGRPLNESLDDLLGRKQWDELVGKLRTKSRATKRGKVSA